MSRPSFAKHFGLWLLLATESVHAQYTLGLGPLEGVAGLSKEVGKRFTFVCPASDGAKASVYGTDVYTPDSAVCAAAIHAGVLAPNQAGVVSIVMGSGAESFPSSKRNGVATRSYGRWSTSYTFARDAAPGTISWRTAWSQVPAEFTAPIELQCPAGAPIAGTVWGTDVYTKGSTICAAAVHAGVIAAASGGLVIATRARYDGAFAASARNGVSSSSWGSTQDAFSVTAPTVGSAPSSQAGRIASTGAATLATQSPAALQRSGATAPTGPGPRTIRLTKLTAEGWTPGPRTLRLASLIADGSSPGPRTIQTPSITSVGSAPVP